MKNTDTSQTFIKRNCTHIIIALLSAIVIVSLALIPPSRSEADSEQDISASCEVRNFEYVESPAKGIEDMYSDGFTGYYIKKNVLYKYDCKTKKSKKLKKLPKKLGLYMSAVYCGKVYMTYGSFDDWCYKTYVYNEKSKKLKYTKKKCSIMWTHGEYAITTDNYATDISPVGVSLYKFTGSGLKKLKTLTKHGLTARFIGDKVYYVHYPKDKKGNLGQMDVYTCDLTGGNRELVTSITDPGEIGCVLVRDMTDEYIDYTLSDEKEYRYTFATKKVEEKK